MKSTGIVRKIDELGRLVIPKELRKMLALRDDIDFLEIYVDNDLIVLKKYEPSCTFCDTVEDKFTYGGRKICTECIQKISALNSDDK